MKLIFGLFVALLPGSLFASSLSTSGMNTVVEVLACNENGTLSSKLLGTYETEIFGFQTESLPGASVDEKIGNALNNLDSISMDLKTDLLRTKFSHVRQSARMVPNNLFSPIQDNEFTTVPQGCELRQLIVWARAGILISEPLWQALSADDQARATIQMAIYLLNYNSGDGEPYKRRLLAQAATSGQFTKMNLLSLPGRGYSDFINFHVTYLANFNVYISDDTQSETDSRWALSTNLGLLSHENSVGVKFDGGKLMGLVNPDSSSRRAGIGGIALQSKVFSIYKNWPSQYKGANIISFYSTGEVCGFHVDHDEVLTNEAGHPQLIEEQSWIYVTKTGQLANDQVNHICQ